MLSEVFSNRADSVRRRVPLWTRVPAQRGPHKDARALDRQSGAHTSPGPASGAAVAWARLRRSGISALLLPPPPARPRFRPRQLTLPGPARPRGTSGAASPQHGRARGQRNAGECPRPARLPPPAAGSSPRPARPRPRHCERPPQLCAASRRSLCRCRSRSLGAALFPPAARHRRDAAQVSLSRGCPKGRG